MILFVFSVFCLTWQLRGKRAAGSLRFVLGGSCRHTQALKQAAHTGDAFTWGPSVCKSKVWEVFPFYGPARCGWHFTYSCITNVIQIQVKGQAYQTPIILGSRTVVGWGWGFDCVHLGWITLSTYLLPMGTITPESETKIQSLTIVVYFEI